MKAKWQSIRRRFAAIHSDHKRIALGAIWVACFVVVAKLTAAAREMAIAWRYGVSETVDAYQLATTLVFWLPSTLVATLIAVLVPMLFRLRQESRETRMLFLSELYGTVILIGVILGAMSLLLGWFVLPDLAGNLSTVSRQITWQLTLGMAPLAPLALLIGVHAARLMARERQVNTLLEGAPAAVLMLFVLFWISSSEIAPLLWGTVLGIVVHAVWLWRLARHIDGEAADVRLSWRSRHWPDLYKAAGIMASGQLVMSIITPLDQYTAAQLGDGAIAALSFGSRLIGLLLGVGAMAYSRAALPVMSELHATGQTARAQNMSMKWAALMLAGGTAVATLAWAFAPWAIKLLFERGAFTSQDTRLVAEVFRWGLIQVPFYFAGLVLVQLLASRGNYLIIALLAASNFLVKLVLNPALSNWMGVAGIALATSLMYAWSAGCLYWAAIRTGKENQTKDQGP